MSDFFGVMTVYDTSQFDVGVPEAAVTAVLGRGANISIPVFASGMQQATFICNDLIDAMGTANLANTATAAMQIIWTVVTPDDGSTYGTPDGGTVFAPLY